MLWTDIAYRWEGPVAVVEINRPERLNAFTAHTIDELIAALRDAAAARQVAAIVLTGTGERAFCVGGDQKQRAASGDYGTSASGTLATEELYRLIRDIPKPVVAAVNGYAFGGGQVIQLVCDVAVASRHAVFAHPGPQVGSFDAGFGSAYLARVVGQRRARQMTLLCQRLDAATALSWGLVNEVVEPDEVLSTAIDWGRRSADLSPTALAVLKHSLNADSEQAAGLGRLCFDTLLAFGNTAEAQEGYRAFDAKRTPDFATFRTGIEAEEPTE